MEVRYAPGNYIMYVQEVSFHQIFLKSKKLTCVVFLLCFRTIQIATDSSNLNSEFCFILKVNWHLMFMYYKSLNNNKGIKIHICSGLEMVNN